MKTAAGWMALGLAVALAGCGMSPEKRFEREKALKSSIEAFTANAVAGKWDEIFRVTDGGFSNSDALKEDMAKPWNPDTTLADGMVASMAWVDDGLAKVKVNWLFQSGSVQSFSSETYVWAWKGGKWKYIGRTLR